MCNHIDCGDYEVAIFGVGTSTASHGLSGRMNAQYCSPENVECCSFDLKARFAHGFQSEVQATLGFGPYVYDSRSVATNGRLLLVLIGIKNSPCG